MMTTGLCALIFVSATTVIMTEAQITGGWQDIESLKCAAKCSKELGALSVAKANYARDPSKKADYCKAVNGYVDCLKSKSSGCSADVISQTESTYCKTDCTCGTAGLTMSLVVVSVAVVLARMTGT